MRRSLARAMTHRSALAATLAVAAGLVAFVATVVDAIAPAGAAAVIVTGHGAAAVVAGLTARSASRKAAGVSRRVWTLFAAGLACWAAGCALYIAFLALGGSPRDPAVWTQIGFLVAYAPWYRALWLLRQPVLARTRRQRIESALVESVALGLIAVVLGAALWSGPLTTGQNLALLLPAVLDLLLVAGLYNAVRRSRLSRSSAHGWLALAFLSLATADIGVNVLVPRGYYDAVGLVLAGYAVAMGLFGTAATRPLRLTETEHGVGRSSTAVGLLSLALVAPAAALLPPAGRYAAWGVGAALLAWLWSRITLATRSDVDTLTGLLGLEAFQRHLAGVLALARADRPAALIVVELDDFADWTAERGFGPADDLMREIGGIVESLDLPEGGVWAHLASDWFAWLGTCGNVDGGRGLAYRVSAAASASSARLEARCGLAIVPGDADTPEDALAAAREAVMAARAGSRRVVAFDRGRLDGLDAGAGYATGIRARRAKILQIIESASALEPVFQPIIALDRMEIMGYEALARFRCDPRQGPDRWIAEAHAVGLGLELEAECLRRAYARRQAAPPGRYMSLNAGPEFLLSHLLDEVLGDDRLDGMVFEITEHHHVADYAELAGRLAILRGRGARVAVDDVGAGHSSMRHVMNLRPDFIKVDRWLVGGINLDSAKRALLRSLVALSAELSADLVVEGVETLEELTALRELGAEMAQGFLFARPDRTFLEIPTETRASIEEHRRSARRATPVPAAPPARAV